MTTQALFQRDRRRGPPLTTPALFADALAEVIPAPLAPPPAAPPPPGPRTGGFARTVGYAPPGSYPPEPPSGYPDTSGWTPSRGGGAFTPPRAGGRPLSRLAIVLVVLLVLAAIGTGVYSLTRPHATAGGGPSKSGSSSASPSVAANTVLTPVSAGGFDALGGANDPGNEDNAGAPMAIDGNPSTSWHTQYYDGNPVFGGLKQGTGLILDMGKPVSLRSVTIDFGPEAGASVAIMVGNNNSVSPQGLASFTKVAKRKHLGGGTQVFQTSSATRGRYVLIWFTRLPPQPGSATVFEAFISNVVVRGSG